MSKIKNPHEVVRNAYGRVAKNASSCCAPGVQSCCGTAAKSGLAESDLGLSCGDPVAFSKVIEGDTVLDLGSGAGRDVFIAAKLVGRAGKVIGVDMTPEMLDLANKNRVKFKESTGLDNVEFREGIIEALPVEDGTIDLVISNCVINLSPDKAQVFREVFRVLKPGGRMVVSDIVLNRELPESLKSNEELYGSCIAGALLREEYLDAIVDAGFGEVEVLKDHVWNATQADNDPIACCGTDSLVDAASSMTLQAIKN